MEKEADVSQARVAQGDEGLAGVRIVDDDRGDDLGKVRAGEEGDGEKILRLHYWAAADDRLR